MKSYAQINLNNLANNTKAIKDWVNDSEIMAIVKADAYGHGALQCSKTVIENGASSLGVATINEAMELREAGIKAPILILTHILAEDYEKAIDNDIAITVSRFEQGIEIQQASIKLKKPAKIQVKVNSGLNRNGFRPDEDTAREIIMLGTAKNIIVEGIYSHLSDVRDKDFVINQQKRFEFITMNAEHYFSFKKHISASSAILEYPELNYDIVRPGLILYGINPTDTNIKLLNLKPVMSLYSEISHIHKVPAGESIGYERSFFTNRDTMAAIVPIGYADGYPSTLSNNARVTINDKSCMVLGKVCMDQIIIDVTDVFEEKNESWKKAEVTLIGGEGKGKIKIEELANNSSLGIRELLCLRSSKRVPRIFVNS
ncbi:MAG: alanine racemase [Defluviitaleaceae bacterium]|nr:alanine racemase [Defluviitaleaceae bacterium]